MAVCRSCGARIRWALTEKRKRIPLDPDPVEEPTGTSFVIIPAEGGDLARMPYPDELDLPRYVSHFASCPFAKSHRRKR